MISTNNSSSENFFSSLFFDFIFLFSKTSRDFAYCNIKELEQEIKRVEKELEGDKPDNPKDNPPQDKPNKDQPDKDKNDKPNDKDSPPEPDPQPDDNNKG